MGPILVFQVMIFVVAMMCCHTGKLLIECMYETSKKTGIRRRLRVNYPEVGEACFGRKGMVALHIAFISNRIFGVEGQI